LAAVPAAESCQPLLSVISCLGILRALPLVSTLFPYTTLFRSACWGSQGAGQARRLLSEPRRTRAGRADRRRSARRTRGSSRRHQDRKSTRLNSSHVKTSYAVFCLKKKRKSASPLAAWSSAHPV